MNTFFMFWFNNIAQKFGVDKIFQVFEKLL